MLNRLQTIAGTEFEIQNFESWNERMFVHYGNDRMYHHPNVLIRMIQAQRIKTIIKFLSVAPSDAVLDAGCGEGYLFSKLGHASRLVGVDLSVTAMRIAAQRNSIVEWLRADLAAVPLPGGMFDKICCSEVLEHVLEPLKVIRELRRLVKPTGRVVITVPCELTINRTKDLVFSSPFGRRMFPGIPIRTEWHLTEYTPALLRSQIRDSFVIARERTLPLPGVGLGYGILCVPK